MDAPKGALIIAAVTLSALLSGARVAQSDWLTVTATPQLTLPSTLFLLTAFSLSSPFQTTARGTHGRDPAQFPCLSSG